MPLPSPNALASSPSPGAPEPQVPERSAILDVIRTIAREELDHDGPVEEGAELARDLALDSMTVVVLAVGLEDTFRIKLDEADAQTLTTVGDLVSLVQQRVGERMEEQQG